MRGIFPVTSELTHLHLLPNEALPLVAMLAVAACDSARPSLTPCPQLSHYDDARPDDCNGSAAAPLVLLLAGAAATPALPPSSLGRIL